MINGKQSPGFKVAADDAKNSDGGKRLLKLLEVKKNA
jgi:hypothetical protein